MNTIEMSIRHAEQWEELAREADAADEYEQSRHFVSGSRALSNKARLYRATALAMREEARTGEAHCPEHAGPCGGRHRR